MKTLVLFLMLLMTGLALSEPVKFGELEETFLIKSGELVVNVDINVGEVKIVRSEDAEKCHVRMTNSDDRCKGDIRYNESKHILDIIIDYDTWKSWKDDHNGDHSPKVLIELPFEPIIELNADFKAGEFTMILGDLSIKQMTMSNWAGEVDIDFDLPNRIVMENIDLNLKVGEMNIQHLGNTRFSQADINSGIGELSVDFSGLHTGKAMARVDHDLGEANIYLPNDTGIKLKVSKFLTDVNMNDSSWLEKRGNYYYSENYDSSEKLLYIMVSSGLGELGIYVR